MTASQMHAPTGYGRRMAVSLAIALCAHVLLLLIPIYRLIGAHPGNDGGIGAVSNPFAGALLGASVTIRTPETRPEAAEPAATAVADDTVTPPAQVTVSNTVPESSEPIEPLDSESFAIEVIPPAAYAGGASRNKDSASDGTGADFGSSLVPLGGGGGVVIEMVLEPKYIKFPDFLTDIVVERKIPNQILSIQVLVDKDGLVIDHRVLMSIPECPECTIEAVRAVYQYVFPQPTYEGERVRAWVTLGIGFGL